MAAQDDGLRAGPVPSVRKFAVVDEKTLARSLEHIVRQADATRPRSTHRRIGHVAFLPRWR